MCAWFLFLCCNFLGTSTVVFILQKARDNSETSEPAVDTMEYVHRRSKALKIYITCGSNTPIQKAIQANNKASQRLDCHVTAAPRTPRCHRRPRQRN